MLPWHLRLERCLLSAPRPLRLAPSSPVKSGSLPAMFEATAIVVVTVRGIPRSYMPTLFSTLCLVFAVNTSIGEYRGKTRLHILAVGKYKISMVY